MDKRNKKINPFVGMVDLAEVDQREILLIEIK
jgi:hypothetical protein